MKGLMGALAAAAGLGLVASVAGLMIQTGLMSGSPADSLDPASLRGLLMETTTGHMTVLRIAALLLSLPVAVKGSAAGSKRPLVIIAGLGAISLGSLAWNGHGAMNGGGPGAVFLIVDIIHLLAAGAWIGALACFSGLLLSPKARLGVANSQAIYHALTDFFGVGAALVALLLLTGLVNSWRLVGPAHVASLLTSPYGRLLSAKVVLFIIMAALAATNRFWFLPPLARELPRGTVSGPAHARLRQAVIVETVISILILALVSWFGTLDPATPMV